MNSNYLLSIIQMHKSSNLTFHIGLVASIFKVSTKNHHFISF
jgi:hypothetical protein